MLRTFARGSTVVLAGLSGFLIGTAAWADAPATLRSGQAPTTAVAFAAHACDPDLGGGPYAAQDVWSFVLPDRGRRFVALTAGFDTSGDGVVDATLNVATSGGTQDDTGTSKAWLVAPAGATLVTASAVVTGDAAGGITFTINRTCPAGAAPSPSVSPTGSAPVVKPSPSKAPKPSRSSGSSRRGSSGGGGGGVGYPTIQASDEAVSEFIPEETAGPSGAPVPAEAAALTKNTEGGLGGVILSFIAAVAVIACATGFMAVRLRRNRLGRPRTVGRHHLARDSQ